MHVQLLQWSLPSPPSPACLVLDGLDPIDAAISEDRTAVVATKTSVVVAKDNAQVSTLPVGYEPQCISRHPGKPEYAVGGKVSGHSRVCPPVWPVDDLWWPLPLRTAKCTFSPSVDPS